jgi:hypothetical protein
MTEEQICNLLAQELQKAIDSEILAMLTNNEPKLVFRKTENPLILEYGMDHGHGSFTPTGMRDYHTEPVAKWCFENSCGVISNFPYEIEFETEAHVAWFLLRWS